MNTHLRPPTLPLSTQAAEGLPRRRWTTAELEAMVRAHILDPEERIELIGGEVVPLPAKGHRHELVADELQRYWVRNADALIWICSERQPELRWLMPRKPICFSVQFRAPGAIDGSFPLDRMTRRAAMSNTRRDWRSLLLAARTKVPANRCGS